MYNTNITSMAFVLNQIGSRKAIVGASQECQTCADVVYTYPFVKTIRTLSVEGALRSFFILCYADVPIF